MQKKTWDEFRETGLLWFINSILHLFGWAIVVSKDGDKQEVYPARVEFRGFSLESNINGYAKVTKYMYEHVNELMSDITEDKDGE